MSEGVPITNTLFPPPPPYYKAFTSEAVARLSALEEGAEAEDEQPSERHELEQALKPPRADWVLEDGRWMVFGRMYTAEPHIPSAKEIGIPPPLDDVIGGPDGGQAALPTLLHSFLHTLLAFIDVLTGTARAPLELLDAGRASEGDQYIQHLNNLAASMMVAANQLRGVQAEATLVMLMEKQLEERRAQTERLRTKSSEVAATIRRLKEMAAGEVAKGKSGGESAVAGDVVEGGAGAAEGEGSGGEGEGERLDTEGGEPELNGEEMGENGDVTMTES